jgi:hypothetical protein
MISDLLYAVGLLWVLLMVTDAAYRGKKWGRLFQKLGQFFLSTFWRTLIVYESLYAITAVLAFLFLIESSASQYLLLWINAVFMICGGFIGMHYAASLRADQVRTYREVLRRALRETDLPEETVRNIIRLHRESPADETNTSVYRALIALSDEPTTVGNTIQKILQERPTI